MLLREAGRGLRALVWRGRLSGVVGPAIAPAERKADAMPCFAWIGHCWYRVLQQRWPKSKPEDGEMPQRLVSILRIQHQGGRE